MSLYQLVERHDPEVIRVERSTRERILDSAIDLFGMRGVGDVSLDEIARNVGVRKQTVLYWFESKDDLVDAVLGEAATQIVFAIDAAVRASPVDPLDRLDEVIGAVFRHAVRRPALLGLIREVSRLDPERAEHLRIHLQPLIDRGVDYLGSEMDAGRLRRGDPRLIAALAYATVTGIATEPEVLSAVGWSPDAVGLRHLRDELRHFLRAALSP